MRLRALWAGILAVALLAWLLLREPDRQVPDYGFRPWQEVEAQFESELLRARVERLRPLVEEVLHEPLGDPVEVKLISRKDWVRRSVKERLRRRAPEDLETPTRVLRRRLETSALRHAGSLLGSVPRREDRIYLLPENYHQFSESELPDVIDVVLAHEMAHVFQQRRFGLDEFLGPEKRGERELARACVLEGHAEYVSRRVARKLGIEAAVERVSFARSPQNLDHLGSAFLGEKVAAARMAFKYEEGERFFARVADEIGYGAAVQRVFTQPPDNLRAIAAPSAYLDAATARDLSVIADQVRLLLGDEETSVASVIAPVLRLHLESMGIGDRSISAARSAVMLGAEIQWGALRGSGFNLILLDSGSPQGARTLLEHLRDARPHEDGLILGDKLIQVTEETRLLIQIDGAPAVYVEQRGRLPNWVDQDIQSLFLVQDRYVLELSVFAGPDRRDSILRLGKHILGVLRRQHPPGPLERAEEDPNAPGSGAVLEEALRDPAPAIRARAARALGRSSGDSRNVELRLAPLLEDAEPEVRESAVHALDRLGWIGRADDRALFKLVRDIDPEVRAALVEALAGYPESPAALMVLLSVIEAGGPRDRALGVLGSFRERASRIEPILLEALDDPDADVRLAALKALSTLGWGARAQQEIFEPLLQDQDARVRGAAVLLFANAQALSETTRLEVLHRMFDDDDRTVRAAVWDAVKDIGGTDGIPAWAVRRGLNDESPVVRRQVITHLLIMTRFVRKAEMEWPLPTNEVVDWLTEVLDDPDPFVRSFALIILGALGEDAAQAVPRLLEELARKEMRPFRSGIVTALGNIGPAAKNAVPDLIQHLDHPDTRFEAIEALGKLGPEAAGAIGALDDLLTYRGRDTRWVAALALHRIDPATKRLLPLLIECLSSDDYFVSSSAESILESNRAISEPALLSALTDERLAVRLGAARVLDDLDHDASQLVPILVEGLESEDAEIRSMAAANTRWFAIGHSSEELARPLVDPLLQVRQDDDGEVREDAVQALGDLELDPERVVPALVQTLESDKDEDVRQAAADALREFGAAASRAVPALCRALGDDEAWVRAAAIGALGDIVPMTPETLVPVAERLADTDTRVREESSEVLRDFFQEQDQAPLRHAKPVLSVIVRVMEKGYAAVRDECTHVLTAIGADAIPTMRALLRHEDEDLRSRAQIWLDEIGAD